MISKKTIKNTLTWVFGIATLATFFYSKDLVTEFLSTFNIIRFTIMIVFIGLVVSTFKDIPAKDPDMGGRKYKSWVQSLVWILPTVAFLFAAINVLYPELGNIIVKGGDVIPFRPAIYVKMGLDLVSCAIFATLAAKFFEKKNWLLFATFILLVLVTFWMSMEEISWGQRIFKWETTGYFAENNMQGETNLHNLNTQLFQNVLYFGGFVLLVVLPFFRQQITKILKSFKPIRSLAFLIPGSWMIGAFAMAIAFTEPYVSDAGWRWSSILFIIIATATILVVYTCRLRRNGDDRAKGMLITTASFMAILILALVFDGLWLQDTGAPTEYIEMFIALGITSWAIDLRLRSSNKSYLLLTK